MSRSSEQIISELHHAVIADPNGYEPNLELGLYMAERRRFHILAEPYLLKALTHGRVDNRTHRVLWNLGSIQMVKGQFELAVETYAMVHRLYPGVLDFAFSQGDVLLRLGRIDEGTALLRRTLDEMQRRAVRQCRDTSRPLTHLIGPRDVVCRYIGEMGLKLDMFTKARQLGLLHVERPVLLAPPEIVVNPCFLDYWRDYLTVVSNPAEIERHQRDFSDCCFMLDYVTLPDGRTWRRDFAHPQILSRWQAEGRPPLLKLKDDHRVRGWSALRRLGVPEGAWFVALHIREAGYFNEATDWSNNAHRNASIQTYLPAIEEIAGRGGWIVRIGDPSMTPLPDLPNVVDLTRSTERSDWLDIFTVAAARFYLGMASGPTSVAVAFGVPILATNWFPLGYWPFLPHDLFIPKRLRERGSGRPLSMQESLAPPLLGSMEPLFFKARGLEVIDNTAEEIRAATTEMLDRLAGTFIAPPDQKDRQSAFRRAADPYGIGFDGHIAADFLTRHPELIADLIP